MTKSGRSTLLSGKSYLDDRVLVQLLGMVSQHAI